MFDRQMAESGDTAVQAYVLASVCAYEYSLVELRGFSMKAKFKQFDCGVNVHISRCSIQWSYDGEETIRLLRDTSHQIVRIKKFIEIYQFPQPSPSLQCLRFYPY